MDQPLDVHAPAALAACRRSGTLLHLPLHALADRAEAEAFQAAAMSALGGEACGHKIGATNAAVQQMSDCRKPIHAPFRRQDVLAGGSTFRIPAGLLGVECEFAFVMARDYPAAGERADLAGLRAAIEDCVIALELVGRRLTDDVPLNEMSATADYALNVAVVEGEPVPGWDRLDLAAMPVHATVDGATVASGSGAVVLGHPLKSLLWLAEELGNHGGRLRAGEIILTGTCTGITKVAGGQTFEGRFADLPPVCVRLE